MARISGVIIDENKPAWTALTKIYGIGRATSKKILNELKIPLHARLVKIGPDKIDKIREAIEKHYKVEGDLRVEVIQNIKRLKEINTYRGLRHTKNLPVRGQRTRTNARTKRGKKVTVGSGRKKSAEKT